MKQIIYPVYAAMFLAATKWRKFTVAALLIVVWTGAIALLVTDRSVQPKPANPFPLSNGTWQQISTDPVIHVFQYKGHEYLVFPEGITHSASCACE